MSAKETFDGLIGLAVIAAGAYYFDIGGFAGFVDSKLDRFVPSKASEVTKLRSNMPSDQLALIDAVVSGRERYKTAENDLAKGAARVWRKDQICATIRDFGFADWFGVVRELSSNNSGMGVLSVSIADGVSVGTWNNALSDIGSGTLIDPASPVFSTATTLHEGDIVRFSGALVTGSKDCVNEQSVSQSGSMLKPEFTVRFTAIERHKPQS